MDLLFFQKTVTRMWCTRAFYLSYAHFHIKEESNDDWIHRVDLALYQAKKQGRDRTIQA